MYYILILILSYYIIVINYYKLINIILHVIMIVNYNNLIQYLKCIHKNIQKDNLGRNIMNIIGIYSEW